jgi:hypothetical protein
MTFGWPERDSAELLLQRVAFAALVYVSFESQPRYTGQPYPVGIATWIDVSVLAAPRYVPWLRLALLAALLLYVAGRAMPLALAVMTLLFTGAGALAYSQGMLEHHTQLLAMVLLAQLVAYLSGGWTLRRAAPRRVHDRAASYSLEVIAAAYVLAGLTKVVLSRGRWIIDLPMIATDIVKSYGQAYCTSGAPGWLARGDAIAAFALTHPNGMRALFAPGPLLELGAGLALVGRRSAFAVGTGLVLMHLGIESMMAISFPESAVLLLIYLVDLPFLLVVATRSRRGRENALPQPHEIMLEEQRRDP